MTSQEALYINMPKKRFRCPFEHEWEANYEQKLLVDIGETHLEYNFCPFCYMDWFKENIPSFEEVK